MDIIRIKEHKLKTLLQFSVPSIIAMLLETLITVTDGYFTGNYVGEHALAAINLGLPILYFYLGTGLCIGVGGTVISGKLLGAGEKEKAADTFSQTVLSSLAMSIIVSLAVMLLFKPLLKVLRADGELSGYFTGYYRLMLIAYPLMVLGTVLGMFIRTDGKPQICMLVSILGCVLNILLDWLFMDRLGMGIRGSAWATLAVQAVTVILETGYFLSSRACLRLKRFRFDTRTLRETVLNGASEFIGEMASAVSMFAFNFVLMKYVGTEGVAAFTILGFTVYGYSMIAIGFGQGLTAPVSFLWGAGERETAAALRKITNRILIGIGVLLAVIFLLFGERYASLFGCGNGVAVMVAHGFRFYAVTFLVMGYDVIGSMYFTGCGDAKSSAMISSLRGIILLLPLTFLFPALWGMNGVWSITPVTEGVTTVVSFLLLRKQERTLAAKSAQI